jgi:hypothetical protein
VIEHLKANGFEASMTKQRIRERDNKYKYSVYEHHPNAIRITGEEAFMQKVNYIHLNPVRAGLADQPNEYKYSSSRIWHARVQDEEPLTTDHKRIKWRAAA